MSVARPLPHDAAHLHVTGQARYVDDVPAPAGTLHLAFGTSPAPCGRSTACDLTDVRAAPGVGDVLVADDLPFDCDVSPSNHDEPLLAKDDVHYVGQAMYLVIATSHLAARHAARRAQSEIDAGEPVLSIADALAADARCEDGPRIYARGDATEALTQAPQTLTGSLHIGGQEHFYLETNATRITPLENGELEARAGRREEMRAH